MKESWRRVARRMAALAVVAALVLLPSAVPCGQAWAGTEAEGNAQAGIQPRTGEESRAGALAEMEDESPAGTQDGSAPVAGSGGAAGERQVIEYSQRAYEHFDPSVLEQRMAAFEQACAAEGQDAEVQSCLDALLEEYDRLSTMDSMAHIAHDRDQSDQAAAGEQEYTSGLYARMGRQLMFCLQKGIGSGYEDIMSARLGSENLSMLENCGISQELVPLLEKEEMLLQEHDRLSSEKLTVSMVDGEWTYERLETEEDLDYDRYLEIEKALDQERNRLLGGNFLELARVRGEIAAGAGYDDYARYAHEALYGRDYSLEDAAGLCSSVKEEIIPLNDAMWQMDIDQDSYSALDGLETASTEEMLDAVEPCMTKVDPSLGEAFRYMRQSQLYDIRMASEDENRAETSYMAGFPDHKDGFVFLSGNHTYRDYQYLIQLFGFFSNQYYSYDNKLPQLFHTTGLDLSGFHSQGLEMLSVQYAGDMMGDGAEAYAYETVTDMLYAAISSCMLHEFEEAVYQNPDMSLDDMNRKFKEIQDSYGYMYFQSYDDMCYEWVDINSLYETPLCYIGNASAALSALDLWTVASVDQDGAADTYMGILKEGTVRPYRVTMSQWGLRDMLKAEDVASLSADIRSLEGLEDELYQPDDGMYQPDDGGIYENSIFGGNGIGLVLLLGFGLVIILLLSVLAVGLVIIWLLVGKKNDR